MENASEYLKGKRKELGLTQQKLADMYGQGLTQYNLSRYETGKCRVPAELILWIVRQTSQRDPV